MARTACSVYVLPFVRIEDHLKLFVRKNEDGTSSISHVTQLIGKRIGYCPDSIHDHFLAAHGLEPNTFSAYEITNVLDGYRMLIRNEIQGCILWEPHYQAFMQFDDVEIVDIEHQDKYSWFLCLASPKQYVDKHGHIASRILSTLRTAVDECGIQRSEAIAEYMSFLHIEFTGIGETQLRQLLESRKHHFGIGQNIDEFKERLNTLAGYAPYAFGAGSLKTSLWPGL